VLYYPGCLGFAGVAGKAAPVLMFTTGASILTAIPAKRLRIVALSILTGPPLLRILTVAFPSMYMLLPPLIRTSVSASKEIDAFA
jgi:hypothetical protein